MALLLGDTAKTPLLDPSMTAAVRRRVRELWGLGLLALAVVIGASLWSYDITDPSPFSATGLAARNLRGSRREMSSRIFFMGIASR